MPSAASWERNSSLDSWHVAEIEYPGVYVEEVPLGVAPIAGVETSTTGFIGAVGSAEPCAPVHVRSLVEFERAFGRVEAGFELGDSRCPVLRERRQRCLGRWTAGRRAAVCWSGASRRRRHASLLCLPGETDIDVLRAAIEYAERRRAFALIDPPGMEVAEVNAYVEALAQSGSANAAVYFPPFEGGDPPSGAVAGVYARVDRERGVWKAPAGEEAVLRGEVALAVDLTGDERFEAELSRRERDPEISGQGCPGVGREDDPGCGPGRFRAEVRPVRRLGLYVEHSIDRGTQWAVSEPNDESTWARLRQQIAVFLTGLFRLGAFAGRRPTSPTSSAAGTTR